METTHNTAEQTPETVTVLPEHIDYIVEVIANLSID